MLAFVVWTLLACSSGYWLLKMLAAPLAVPAHAQPAADARVAGADLSRLFGATPEVLSNEPAPVEDGRFKLVGVVAPKLGKGHAGEGVAVVAVDGVPKAVRVGSAVDADLLLMSLDRHSATLGRGGVASQVLKLEPLPPAATGNLSANSATVGASMGAVVLTPTAPARPSATPREPPPPPSQPPQANFAVPEVLPPGPNAVPLR